LVKKSCFSNKLLLFNLMGEMTCCCTCFLWDAIQIIEMMMSDN
jgi:hypothetical protein